jgi:hypothetical protein
MEARDMDADVVEVWSFQAERRRAYRKALGLREEARSAAAQPEQPAEPRPEPVRTRGKTPPPPVEAARPLLLYVSCPRCGGNLDIVATGRPQLAGRELRYVVRCKGRCRPQVIRFKMSINPADTWEDWAETSREAKAAGRRAS